MLQAEMAIIEQNKYPIVHIVPYIGYSMAKIYPIGYNRKIFGYNILPKKRNKLPSRNTGRHIFFWTNFVTYHPGASLNTSSNLDDNIFCYGGPGPRVHFTMAIAAKASGNLR